MAEKKSSIIDSEDLLLVGKFISKNWLYLLLIPAIAAGLAYLYTHRMPEVFGAKTELLLKSGSNYEYQNQIYRGLTGFGGGYDEITNQKRILQSHDLISETLYKLDFEISYFIVGRVKTTEVPFIDAFNLEITLLDPDLYQVPFVVSIRGEGNYTLSFEKDGDIIERDYPFDETITSDEFIITLRSNKNLSDENFKLLQSNRYEFIVNDKNFLINKYKNDLEIFNADKTSILELSITDGVPSRAKMFLDTLSKVYIDYTLRSQIDLNENTLEYIDRQLSGISLILDSIETKLKSYKDQKDILDLTREQEESFNNLLRFETQSRELQLQLKTLESLKDYLLNLSDERLLPPALYILDDAFLQSSLDQLYNAEVKRNQLLYDSKTDAPGVLRGDQRIEALRANVLVYIKNLRTAIFDKLESVNNEIAYYEHVLREIPQSQRDILNIERNLEVNEKMFVYLLEKKANTTIARAAIIPQTSIIEVARIMGSVGPNKARITYLFLGAGFILALFVAFIRSVFFEKIENTRELKQITQLPIIGGIPHTEFASENRLVISSHPKSNIAEAFRSIRTNLQYFGVGDQGRVILITSLHPGEGKTFSSINFAAIVAKADKKVLLLDLDMHKPKIHTALSLNNSVGMSTFLIGRDGFDAVVQKTDIENLDVVTAGPIPPNASELVLSKKVEQLLMEKKQEYDYIIIDTPPLMLISDSMVLMRLIDTGIYVLNTKRATKAGIRHLEEIVENNKLSNVTLLLNNIKTNRWKYYYSKYGYKYGYGYGYRAGYGYGYGYEKKPGKNN